LFKCPHTRTPTIKIYVTPGIFPPGPLHPRVALYLFFLSKSLSRWPLSASSNTRRPFRCYPAFQDRIENFSPIALFPLPLSAHLSLLPPPVIHPFFFSPGIPPPCTELKSNDTFSVLPSGVSHFTLFLRSPSLSPPRLPPPLIYLSQAPFFRMTAAASSPEDLHNLFRSSPLLRRPRDTPSRLNPPPFY